MPYRKTENRIQHSEEMKDRLLNSAAEVLAAEGFKALTVRRTIEAAGTSNGNFYFYFKDKTDLLSKLVDRELAVLGGIIDKAGEAAAGEGCGLYGVLASMMYTGICLGLKNTGVPGILLLPELRTLTDSKLREYMYERTQKVLADSNILPEGLSASMAAILWQGSLLTVINEFKETDMPDTSVAEQAAAWNLRAVGVGEDSIDQALFTAEKVWKGIRSR